MGGTVSSAGPGKWGNKAELAGEGGALHLRSIPGHGDPASKCWAAQTGLTGCVCTLAAAAAAVGKLSEAARTTQQQLCL